MQKKRWILPASLLLGALLFASLGLWHYLSCISELEAFQIASDYIREKGIAPQDSSFEFQESLLTCDIARLVTGDQEWILRVTWPDDYYGKWIHLDAHTGRVTEMQQGFQEWWTPIAIPNLHNMFSVLSAAFYALTVLFSFFYWKRKTCKELFWIFLVLSCGYPALYACGAIFILAFVSLAG